MLHSILSQSKFDYSPDQRRALTAAERVVVVTAGAGAGKTRTLVARYLALLASGIDLRRVAAITFTRKAAREMRNRVRKEISTYLTNPKNPAPADRDFWQAIYRNLDAARIGTIHSLCAEILRSQPAATGLDPRFELLDEGIANILRGQAVDDALSWAAENAAMLPLFAQLGEYRLRAILGSLLARRLDAAETFAARPAAPLEAWQRRLHQLQQETLAGLEANPDWQAAVDYLRNNKANKADDRMEAQRQTALAILATTATGPLPERLAALARLDDLNLVGGAQGNWPGGKSQLEAVKAGLRALRDQWRANARLLTLALNTRDELLANLLPPLGQLFSEADRRYRAQKEARSALDFDDLEEATLRLLADFPEARADWQLNLETILVDEFQDTNRRQSALLELLQGSHTHLFVVGDAKQSIYRFRGADVTVYRQKQAEAPQVYQLGISYRAHAGLIEALNRLLEPVLGPPTADMPLYAAPFAPLGAFRAEPDKGVTPPYVETHLAVGAKSDGGLNQAALAVAHRLRQIFAATQLTAGDVAILCRSSGAFAAYENALEAAGLPFLTVAGRGFYHRPEIRDLLNALQALADPTDDLALAGLLRSPVVGLSDTALYRLAQGEAGPSLWATLRLRHADLPLDESRRAADAINLIETLHQQAGKTAIADLLKAFLDATGYRAALLRAGQQRAARNVSKLLADAHASGLVSVGEFLEYVAGLRDSGSREGEARAVAAGAVQIMSVHAAKGLEFPVVVLGDAANSGGGAPGLILNPELGALLPLTDEEETAAVYRLGGLLEAAQEEAEQRRLLYVAATRAAELLIINGNVTVNKEGRLGLGGWLKWLAKPLGLEAVTVEAAGAEAIPLELALGGGAVYPPQWAAGFAAAPDSTTVTANGQIEALPLLRSLLPEQPETPAELPERVWQVVAPPVHRPNAPGWVIGTLVHAALAAWRFPAAGFDDWAVARARACGLTDRYQLEQAARAAGNLLRRLRAHPLFEEMNEADCRRHEVPFDYQDDAGAAHSGQIDALYRHNGRWVVVEFKTDSIANAAKLAETLRQKDYLAQMEQYQAAVTRLLGEAPVVWLCLLDFAGEVRPLSLAEAQAQVTSGK